MRNFKLLLIMFLLCFIISGGCVFASDGDRTVNVSIPTFDVTVNDIQYNSKYSEYPFLIYNDVTYMPMTYDLASFMGINITFDKGVNSVYHTDEMILHIGNGELLKETLGQYINNNANNYSYTAKIPEYHTYISYEADEYNNDSLYPVINFRGITYLPLTWDVIHTMLDFDYFFDQEQGLIIESRNAVRPKGVNNKLFNRMGTSTAEYVMSEHSYLRYDVNIYYSGNFLWVTEDGFNEYNFTEELKGKINYFNRMYVNGALVAADRQPEINDGILTIMCAKQDLRIENVILTIDLNNGVVLDIE